MFFVRKPSIAPEQAAAAVAKRQLVLVDVREPGELRAGRVRGAINIPLGQLLRARVHELGGDRVKSRSCATPAPAAPARPASPSRPATTPSTCAAGSPPGNVPAYRWPGRDVADISSASSPTMTWAAPRI